MLLKRAKYTPSQGSHAAEGARCFATVDVVCSARRSCRHAAGSNCKTGALEGHFLLVVAGKYELYFISGSMLHKLFCTRRGQLVQQ